MGASSREDSARSGTDAERLIVEAGKLSTPGLFISDEPMTLSSFEEA
jgi:hypothetical protein